MAQTESNLLFLQTLSPTTSSAGDVNIRIDLIEFVLPGESSCDALVLRTFIVNTVCISHFRIVPQGTRRVHKKSDFVG
jgi:hypothetical protein